MEITNEQLRQYRDQGFFVLDVPFGKELVSELEHEFRLLWEKGIREATDADETTRHLMETRPFLVHPHKYSAVCAEFLKHPTLAGLCRKMLGDNADCLYNQAVIKPPSPDKTNSFAWHQDAYYGIHGAHSSSLDHEALLDDRKGFVCWVAVTRTTLANGTVCLAPGIHRQGLLPHTRLKATGEWDCRLEGTEVFPGELNRGQMLVFFQAVAPSQWAQCLQRDAHGLPIHLHGAGSKQ